MDTEGSSLVALWGFLGTIVGAGASIATSWIVNHNEIKKQQQADSLERIERARSFQRETLLEVQQTIHDLMRSYTRMHIEDMVAFKQNNEWGQVIFSEEVNEGLRATNEKLAVLRVRVSDDEVRESIKKFVDSIVRHHLAKNEKEAESVINEAQDSFKPLIELIGRKLRSLY